MRFLSPPVVLIATAITGAIIIGSVVYYYQRETTSIEAKYLNRVAEDIDANYHRSYFDDSFDPTDPSSFTDAGAIHEDDYYSDNLVSEDELSNRGVKIRNYKKEACTESCSVPNGSGWRSSVEAETGDTVLFRIHAEVENNFSGTRTLRLGDMLGKLLAYQNNSASFYIDEVFRERISETNWIVRRGPSSPAPYSIEWYDWLKNSGYRIFAPGLRTTTIDITFSALVLPPGRDDPCSTDNTSYIWTSGKQPLPAQAQVGIEDCDYTGRRPFGGTNWRWNDPNDPSPPDPGDDGGDDPEPREGSIADNLRSTATYKYVRNISRGEDDFRRYTIAGPGDNLEFLIHARLGDTSRLTAPLLITDILGIGIDYQSGTSVLKLSGKGTTELPDDWFSGYSLTPEDLRGVGSLEILFRTNIEPEYWRWSASTTTNTARFSLPDGYIVDKIALIIIDK